MSKPKLICDGQLPLAVHLAVLVLALVDAAACEGHLPVAVLLAVLELALVEVAVFIDLECFVADPSVLLAVLEPALVEVAVAGLLVVADARPRSPLAAASGFLSFPVPYQEGLVPAHLSKLVSHYKRAQLTATIVMVTRELSTSPVPLYYIYPVYNTNTPPRILLAR